MIELINLSTEAGHKKILKDISLNIENGNSLALLGPSGSGKTSILRVIAGLDRPSKGEVRIDGQRASSPGELLPPAKRRISMIFQNLALWPHMTAWGNIEFVLNKKPRKTKEEVREKIESLLDMVHLQELKDMYPGELSGGERQRLAIARALGTEPRYLLMDEPFSNLDDLLRTELLRFTQTLKDRDDMTLIYVTHNVEEALLLGDMIAVINKGAISRIWRGEEIKYLTKEKVLENYL